MEKLRLRAAAVIAASIGAILSLAALVPSEDRSRRASAASRDARPIGPGIVLAPARTPPPRLASLARSGRGEAARSDRREAAPSLDPCPLHAHARSEAAVASRATVVPASPRDAAILERSRAVAKEAVAAGDRVFLPLLRSDDPVLVHAVASELRATPGPLRERFVLAGLAAIALDARSPLESRAVAVDLIARAPGANAASVQELETLAQDPKLGARARHALSRINAGNAVGGAAEGRWVRPPANQGGVR